MFYDVADVKRIFFRGLMGENFYISDRRDDVKVFASGRNLMNGRRDNGRTERRVATLYPELLEALLVITHIRVKFSNSILNDVNVNKYSIQFIKLVKNKKDEKNNKKIGLFLIDSNSSNDIVLKDKIVFSNDKRVRERILE